MPIRRSYHGDVIRGPSSQSSYFSQNIHDIRGFEPQKTLHPKQASIELSDYEMSFLRPMSAFRSAVARPNLSATPRARILTQVRFATQDYGSGEGNPAGESPEKQGKNPSEHIEHPGPPAPKVAQGKSPSPDESGSSSSDSQGTGESGVGPGGSGGKTGTAGGDGASEAGNDAGSKVNGAQPKILNENPPGEQDESVRQHNAEMEQRAEKAYEQVSNEDAKKDKAPPGFWSGEFEAAISLHTAQC
jgi:hypothetical protein